MDRTEGRHTEVLNIDRKSIGGWEFIALDGEVDMYVAPKIREALLGACKECTEGVAVDLRGVTYMDSSGIATLIEGLQWRRRQGGRFILLGVQQKVMDTLKLARLHEVFEIYADEGELFRNSK